MFTLLKKITKIFALGKKKIEGEKGSNKKPEKHSNDKNNIINAEKTGDEKKVNKKFRFIKNICLLILIFIIIDIILVLTGHIFAGKIPYPTFIFIVIVFIEVIFILCCIIVYTIIFNKNRLQKQKALKQEYKKILKWCKIHNVKFKKIPCFLIIGNAGSGKSTFLQKARYNLLDSSLQENEKLKKWVSRSSLAISIDDSCIGTSYLNINKTSFIESLLKVMQKRNDNAINAVIIAIPSETFLDIPEEKLHDLGKNISGYITSIMNVLNRKIPVYFLITKCDKIVGTNSFFSTLSQISKQNVFGYTSKQKNDEQFDLNSVNNDLDQIVVNLEDMRKKLLMQVKLPEIFKHRINYIDSFYPFTFYVKSIILKMKSLLEEVNAGLYHNSMDFPFRGFYFISAKNGYISNSAENNLAINEIVQESAGEQDDSEEGTLFLTDLIDKIIYKEVNTVIPLSLEFYKKRFIKRLILLSAVIVVSVLSYIAYVSYLEFQPQINKIYNQWNIINDDDNWNYNAVLSVLGYKVATPTKKKTFDRKKSIGVRTLTLDPVIKLTSGEPVYEYLNKLITSYNSTTVNYPLFFKPYRFINYTNVSGKESEALNKLFVTSFVNPIFEIYLNTFLNNNIKWDETTYNAFWSLIRLFAYLDLSKNSKSVFLNRLTNEDASPKFITDIIEFIYKNNTSERDYNLEEVLKWGNRIVKESRKFNKYFYANISWNKALGIEKFIKNNNDVNDKNELEFYFIKRFQKLLDFPLIKDDNFDTKLSYEDFLHANSILETINTSAQVSNENNKNKELLAWVQAAKKLAQYIITDDYYSTDNNFYLENYSDVENNLKKSNNKNAAEILIALNFNSDKNVFESVITRSPIDQFIFTISNEYAYTKYINFYEKYSDIKDRNPICRLELPEYWTALYLLFDGPNIRPINYKFDYWVTWSAAEFIKDDQWKTKIRIIGENNKEYCFFIKFTLNSNIAKALKELINLDNNKSIVNQKLAENKKTVIFEQKNLKENQSEQIEQSEQLSGDVDKNKSEKKQ